MILVITNSADETADYLCGRMGLANIRYARLNTDQLSEVGVSYSIGDPTLALGGELIKPEDVLHVWLRRPQRLNVGLSRDPAENEQIAAEWSESIEGFLAHIPPARWVNFPANNAVASHKLEQLSRASSFGLAVPRTLLTQDRERLLQFWREVNGRLVVKPLAHGYLERSGCNDSIIYTSEVSQSQLGELGELATCPALFQERIEKTADVRICVVDDRAIAVALRSSDPKCLDVRRNNMAGVHYEQLIIPAALESSIFRLVRSYGLRFAAIDMALTRDSCWVFFEVNPNGQWAWLDLLGAADTGSLLLEAFAA